MRASQHGLGGRALASKQQETQHTALGDDAAPGIATLLGALGLLPFAAIGIALWFVESNQLIWLSVLLTTYAAIILSFMGGVYWGMAMASPARGRNRWYAIGVLPALIGWCATMLTPAAGLMLMGAAFAGVYALDLAAVAQGLAPPWYRRLRRPLTVGVIISLMIAAGAV